MHLAKRIQQLPPYLFVEISRKIARKKAEGIDVISLAIGDPDIPTPQHILRSLLKASHDPVNHRYPESDGLPELRKAIAGWYEARFGLAFDPDKEVLPLIGSKEGIGHIALCFLDPGDIALVPEPGYPVYALGTLFAGGESYYLPLTEENDFLPDLDKVPPEVARKARVLWINYPNNPTSATAEPDFFEKVVSFAKRYDIPVCHDNAYSEVAYDGYKPSSFLQVKGAKDIGVEFHSCSKSYNMTGWRIGMLVGNAQMVNALMRVKSNLDSGIPQAVQLAAIEALTGPQDCIERHNRIYQKRRDKVVDTLRQIGLQVRKPKGSLYIWARVPQGHTSASFTEALLEDTAVVVTPGASYGQHGEGYIRISLTTPDNRLNEALDRMRAWRGGKAVQR